MGRALSLAVLLWLLGLPEPLLAQEASAQVTVPRAEKHEIRAADGTAFDVFVALPRDYVGDGSVEYPVFYLIDASQMFAAVVQIYRLMEFSGDLPPMILVGVDRGGVTWDEWWVKRLFDLTPTADPEVEAQWSEAYDTEARSGGADLYLQTLQNDVIPWVEARYAEAPERGIGGFSLGGLFVVHALFSAPDTFTHYLVTSPSLFWGGRVAFENEAAYADEFADLTARVFMSAGSLEGSILRDVLRLGEVLEGQGYPGLELEIQTLADESHMSGPFLSISRGLRFLFGTL